MGVFQYGLWYWFLIGQNSWHPLNQTTKLNLSLFVPLFVSAGLPGLFQGASQVPGSWIATKSPGCSSCLSSSSFHTPDAAASPNTIPAAGPTSDTPTLAPGSGAHPNCTWTHPLLTILMLPIHSPACHNPGTPGSTRTTPPSPRQLATSPGNLTRRPGPLKGAFYSSSPSFFFVTGIYFSEKRKGRSLPFCIPTHRCACSPPSRDPSQICTSAGLLQGAGWGRASWGVPMRACAFRSHLPRYERLGSGSASPGLCGALAREAVLVPQGLISKQSPSQS